MGESGTALYHGLHWSRECNEAPSLLRGHHCAGGAAIVEEAINCFEYRLYRVAVVSSWIAAVQVLQQPVYAHHLAAFNIEALRVDAKWKPAKTTDDFGRMKESEFLDRLVALSVIGKDIKRELVDCLDRRNGCGHPNSMKLGSNTVAHHLEILLLNIFKVFQ